jgi:hypothetical protein
MTPKILKIGVQERSTLLLFRYGKCGAYILRENANLLSIYSFAVYVGSSIYSPAIGFVMEEFGVSSVAASIGLALYVLACVYIIQFQRSVLQLIMPQTELDQCCFRP